MRPLPALATIRQLQGLMRPLQGPMRPLQGLMNPLQGLATVIRSPPGALATRPFDSRAVTRPSRAIGGRRAPG